MTKLFAVFGNPILHSKSPQLFNALHEKRSYYTRIKVQSAADVAEAIRALNIQGANITAPFKEGALPFVDTLTAEVTAIGCTNTIVNDNGRLTAYNTDWFGATQAIKESGIAIDGTNIVLLGAGGAGKAVAYGLVKEGAKLTIVNRTLAKAQHIAENLGCEFADIEKFNDVLSNAKLLVSTILPHSGSQLFCNIPKGIAIFDANYHNSELIKVAQRQGNPIVDASQWLLYQGQMAYEHFLGKSVDCNILKNGFANSACNNGKAIAVCDTETNGFITDNLWITSAKDAVDAIDTIRPELIIYTPKLSSKQAEELYNDERNKAIEH